MINFIRKVLFMLVWYRWDFRLSDSFGSPALGAGLIRKRNRKLLQERRFDEEPKIEDFGLPVPADLSLANLPTICDRTITGIGACQYPDPFLPDESVLICTLRGRGFRIVYAEEAGDEEGQVEWTVAVSCRGYRDIFLSFVDGALVSVRRKYGGTTRRPVLSVEDGRGVIQFMNWLLAILE